jgi:hypothetical protein
MGASLNGTRTLAFYTTNPVNGEFSYGTYIGQQCYQPVMGTAYSVEDAIKRAVDTTLTELGRLRNSIDATARDILNTSIHGVHTTARATARTRLTANTGEDY